MPITQSLNSKANVKKSTNQDLPFSPAQPVIARYVATSTAGQTVINLSFSVDTTFTDTFFLFVDGKKLTIGTGNDYIFTAIGSDGTSSQVTLNQSLPVNLNIEAFKLGLKKESEFQTDNRFVTAYDYLDQAFQAFVSQTAVRTATTTVGTPAAGTFYSTVSNRAPMVDLSQDLKARMGIDRMTVQQIYALPTEFGPNGELVYAAVNDTLGQIRMVGFGWTSLNTSGGQAASSANVGDYVEVTFYGTGLNLLTWIGGNSSTDYRVSVDGGSEGSNVYPVGSAVISSRGYSPNSILNVASGLALGIHTVKIRLNGLNFNLNVFAFDILNESALVKVNSGISYLKGQKYVTAAQQSFSYSAPVTGTRGGRVVVYQKSDGTIGQAWQATNSAQAVFAAADHTNEEILRIFQPREFSAGRSDDFSSLTGTAASKTFTLDDGTTSLTCQNARINSNTVSGDGINNPSSTADFIQITFVGTGLDIQTASDGTASAENVKVDGVSIGSFTYSSTNITKQQKIVSGLPYGTHVVTFSQASVTNSNTIFKFIVYHPKKPAIPSGSVELADYNVMATYVASTSPGIENVATGTLRKSPTREGVYTGTGWAVEVAYFPAGFPVKTATSGDAVQYTFFGTGFEIVAEAPATNNAVSISIDGVAYTGSATALGVGNSWTAGSSSWTVGSGSTGGKLLVSGLSLGLHTVKMTKSTSTDNIRFDSFDAIVPIHVAKSNLYSGLQNTLIVGSQSISDNRKTTVVKDALPATKAWAQAVGITGSPTTSTSSPSIMPDMSIPIKTGSGRLRISFTGGFQETLNSDVYVQIYVDGVAVGILMDITSWGTGQELFLTNACTVPVSAGTHLVQVYWYTNSGTAQAYQTHRILTAEEA